MLCFGVDIFVILLSSSKIDVIMETSGKWDCCGWALQAVPPLMKHICFCCFSFLAGKMVFSPLPLHVSERRNLLSENVIITNGKQEE